MIKHTSSHFMEYCIYIFFPKMIYAVEAMATGYVNTVLNHCCVQYQIYDTSRILYMWFEVDSTHAFVCCGCTIHALTKITSHPGPYEYWHDSMNSIRITRQQPYPACIIHRARRGLHNYHHPMRSARTPKGNLITHTRDIFGYLGNT